MNNKERMELAHWVVGQCKQAGADEASANIDFSRSVTVKFQQRQLDTLKEATQNALSLSIYLGGRYSNHTTNDLSRGSLERFASEAVAMTKYLAVDPERSITDAKYYQGLKPVNLEMRDSEYESVTPEDRVRIAQACEEAALAASDRVITCSGEYSDTLSESTKVHSNGFEGENSDTYFDAYAEATVTGEGDGRPDDYEYSASRFRNKLVSSEELGKLAVERALSKVGQTKIDSGTYDMIVENRTANRLLGAMIGPMSGASIYRKNSFLIDKIGEKISSDKLTIIDDPFVKTGMGSRLFDGDGMPTKRRVVIDKGVLKTYFIDWYYSRKLQMEPTTGGTSNLVFGAGTKSLDELVASASKAILVTSFVGGNSNSTTGDFSYGVIGHLVEDGKIVKPVNEMNISGNFGELWNKLAEMGNDVYTISSWRRPSMYFKDVPFAGK